MQSYHTKRDRPLNKEEIEEKYKDILDEFNEVKNWLKEEEEKLKADNFSSHQAKSACKRNIGKAKKRVNSVKGMVDYWKNRVDGMSHFRASIRLNEYWAKLKENSN